MEILLLLAGIFVLTSTNSGGNKSNSGGNKQNQNKNNTNQQTNNSDNAAKQLAAGATAGVVNILSQIPKSSGGSGPESNTDSSLDGNNTNSGDSSSGGSFDSPTQTPENYPVIVDDNGDPMQFD